jgi:hypothetical protein
MIRNEVRQEQASGNKFDPEVWSPHATKPGFMEKLLRVLDDLEGYGEEGPEHANLPQQERDPEGARHVAPHSAVSGHSDEKKKEPKNEVDYTGQSGCGTEHNRDLPWVAKGPEYKRQPSCGSEHNLSLVGGTGQRHKRVEAEQDQRTTPRPFRCASTGKKAGPSPRRRLGKNRHQAVRGAGR